jgi:hypothetical protein
MRQIARGVLFSPAGLGRRSAEQGIDQEGWIDTVARRHHLPEVLIPCHVCIPPLVASVGFRVPIASNSLWISDLKTLMISDDS